MNSLVVKEEQIEPIYVWEASKEFRPSKRQDCLIRAWLEKPNLSYVRAKMLRECGKAPSNSSIEWMLNMEIVKQTIAQRMEESGMMTGWTEGRWLKVMTDHLEGKKRLGSGDLYAMKLIASVKGFENKVQGQFTGSINIVQQNGRP